MIRNNAKTPKAQYPLSVLPVSKRQFQDIMARDEKKVWQLFRDMLQAYEEKFGKKPADKQPAA